MNRIIVALKTMKADEAVEWAKMLAGKVWGFKFNTMLYGDLSFIKRVKEYGNIMADAKVYEIPQDMENSVYHLVKAGADIVTVHCSALWTPPPYLQDKVVGVTVLTSFDNAKSRAVYGTVPSAKVGWFMKQLQPVGYKYFVCSALDLRSKKVAGMVKAGQILSICPSIRVAEPDIEGGVHSRKMTPGDAVRAGAHLIVVGRPILQADDPISIVDIINKQISEATIGKRKRN